MKERGKTVIVMIQIRIGSRGSQLAMWQARHIQSEIKKRYPDASVIIKTIKTTGDKILDAPLAKIGGKGLFVKEIEDALLNNEIDLAVHSMKDVPAIIPDGLCLAAITKREDPRDVLISRNGKEFLHLPAGAHIGTSSLRRISQLLSHRPDLNISPLRGNLDTRIKKLDSGAYDAIILAAAGVIRMGWAERITEYLPVNISLPAIGQGALCIECREDDNITLEKIKWLNHNEDSLCIRAERAFLKRLEGGCQVPIGAYATINKPLLEIEGFVASVNGKRMVREKKTGSTDNPEDIGIRLAESLLSQGGEEILREIYGQGKGK